MEWQDGGEFRTTPRAHGGQKEREGSRGVESEAKALAGAGRGVGERSEAGRGDHARSAQFASGRAQTRAARRTRFVAGWRHVIPALRSSHFLRKRWRERGKGLSVQARVEREAASSKWKPARRCGMIADNRKNQ